MKYIAFSSLVLMLIVTFSNCNNNGDNSKINTYQEVKKQVKDKEVEKTVPIANIDELEMEVNNGGLKQYFINSSGQNCFETLRLLKNTGKIKTAGILEDAITLINPGKLTETEFIEKLRKRKVEDLYNEKISENLDALDQKFYEYPDGVLK